MTLATGDAYIESLEPFGLAVVPGYDANDDSWRERWQEWRDGVIRLRDKVDIECRNSEQFRLDQMALYSEDPGFFVAMTLWIEEPRVRAGEDVVKPFLPFAYQVKLLQDFRRVCENPLPEDRYYSKARGLGASWTMCAAAYWAWLFRDWRGKMVSRKEDLVDKPLDLDSLFGKIDFFLRYTPPWLIPPGFNKGDHRLKLMLKNPSNGAQISGESTSSKTARGARSTYIVYDEAAFIMQFNDVWGTGSGTTEHRFGVSSESFQEGEDWWQAWNAAKRVSPEQVAELDYWLNPYFSPSWFLAEEKRWKLFDPEGFRREYLRDPFAGAGDWVYPTVRELEVKPLDYDPTAMLVVGIDPGHADDTAIVWGQPVWVDGNRGIHWLDSYERNLAPVEWFAHLLTGMPPEPGDEAYNLSISSRERELMEFFASLPHGTDRVRFYMDPAGAAKHSGVSFFDLFVKKTGELRRRDHERKHLEGRAQALVPLYKALTGQARLHDERRYATRRLLPYSTFNDVPGGRRIKEALSNYRFAEMTGKSTGEPKPLHDRHSHIATAVEYVSTYASLGLADPPRKRTYAGMRKLGGRKQGNLPNGVL